VAEDLNLIYTIIGILLTVLAAIIIGNHFTKKSGEDIKQSTDKILKNHEEIKALINQRDISSSLNKIIEVNDGIIDSLESISNDAKEGDVLFLKGKSAVFDVTLKSNDYLDLNGDFTFTHPDDMIQLLRVSGKWKEISKTDNP